MPQGLTDAARPKDTQGSQGSAGANLTVTFPTLPQGTAGTSGTSGTTKYYYESDKNLTNKTTHVEELKKELEYLQGFLASVEKKLSNERFVQNAKPEVIELEKKKKYDAEAKIKAVKESLQKI